MPTATQTPEARVDALPEDVESPRAKLVYLYLEVCDGGTTDELRERLDVPSITLLPVLESLRERGHVERRGDLFVPAA